MIEITPSAQEYFSHLISQQDEDNLGLRIQVLQPGTPGAGCDLQFCQQGENQGDDLKEDYEGFTLFVAASSADWLQEAEIDFETEQGGGQLTIKAPKIKGDMPEDDASLQERVTWVIQSEINPRLASHGGHVSLTSITEKMEVILQFGGGCQGCGMADHTLKQGIEKTLVDHFPEITAVLDATDHATGENPYYTSSS